MHPDFITLKQSRKFQRLKTGMPKVVLWHNVLSPYRVQLFRKLHDSSVFSFDILVGKTGASKMYPHWKTNQERTDLSCKVLKSIDMPFGDGFVNPSLLIEFIKGKYSAIIGGGDYEISTYMAFLFSILLRKPFIFWTGAGSIRGSYSMRKRTMLEKAAEPIIRFIDRHSDSIIAYGNNTKHNLMKLGVPSNKIFIAPNSIDIGYIERLCEHQDTKKEEIKRILNIEKKKVVLFTGRLMRGKRIDLLIEAFAQLQGIQEDVSLLIIGEGPARKELMQMCDDLGVADVHFLGPMKREDVFSYYMICDVYVLPSEGGITLNEAMACGKPVIATRNAGDVDDLIQRGANGVIVDEEDPTMLENAIRYILSNPEKATLMGKESKRIINGDFTIDNMINAFERALIFAIYKRRADPKNNCGQQRSFAHVA
jgi:glycosyltransferase involved in cell wall biosynthesis